MRIPTYVPIFRAKAGELEAMARSTPDLLQKVLPLLDVPRISKATRDTKWFKRSPTPVCAYLDRVAETVAKSWRNRTAIIDMFQWMPDDETETGEHVFPYFCGALESRGVKVFPVVGYDRWDSKPYREALRSLDLRRRPCFLRLDSEAIGDASDPEFFSSRIDEIVEALDLTPPKCAVILDFGDLTSVSVERLTTQAETVLGALDSKEFAFIVTAGSSLPASIDLAVKTKDSTGTVLRKEMILWQTLRVDARGVRYVFGDYGVRGPNSADEVIAPQANGKIRYTVSAQFFIARGHSKQQGNGTAQMYDLAGRIVESAHYRGDRFSWGDAQIMACSNGEFIGNPTTWISIDTNHHLASIVEEVTEFETQTAAQESEEER